MADKFQEQQGNLKDDILDFNDARKYTLDDIGDVSSYPDVTNEILDDIAWINADEGQLVRIK